jgi:thymidylate synthase (FAD)
MPVVDIHRVVPLLDHGSVQLLDHMCEDLDPVNAARVSFAQESKELDERGQGLIRYLMRERHTTPFEQNAMKFRIKAPIFVLREWQRHRIGWSYNEQSGRYMELSEEFYIPAPSDVRARIGKPGHYRYVDANSIQAGILQGSLANAYSLAWSEYQHMLRSDIAPELARLCLPVATYSTMITTCNAHSLMHFLKLRMAPNAQFEIRVYAYALYGIFEQLMPHTCAEFYHQVLVPDPDLPDEES